MLTIIWILFVLDPGKEIFKSRPEYGIVTFGIIGIIVFSAELWQVSYDVSRIEIHNAKAYSIVLFNTTGLHDFMAPFYLQMTLTNVASYAGSLGLIQAESYSLSLPIRFAPSFSSPSPPLRDEIIGSNDRNILKQGHLPFLP